MKPYLLERREAFGDPQLMGVGETDAGQGSAFLERPPAWLLVQALPRLGKAGTKELRSRKAQQLGNCAGRSSHPSHRQQTLEMGLVGPRNGVCLLGLT